MRDEGSEDSSDDSFSYKNTAKRAFETVKKKIAAVKPSATASVVDFSSSDSDCNSKYIAEALPVTGKTSALLKQKSVTHSGVRKSKRLRSACSKALNASSKPQSQNLDVCSTDSDSVEDSREFHSAISSAGLTSKPGNTLAVKSYDIGDSDEIESNGHSKEIVVLSDSSEVDPLTHPEITVVSKDEEGNDGNELISIKISWKLQPIQKFHLRRHQKFKVLMEHFSKLEGVPLQKIVIYGGRNNCRLIEPYDTPDTVGITVTDILEGGVVVEGGEVRVQRLRGLAGQQGDGITVRVQLEGVRSFPVMIGCHQRMQVLLVKVAEQMEVDVDKVRLCLDGDVVSPNSTAKELDLEEGDVFDVCLL